jgi:hypothetical protein
MLEKGQSDLYYKHYSYKANIVGIDDHKKTVRQEFLIFYQK